MIAERRTKLTRQRDPLAALQTGHPDRGRTVAVTAALRPLEHVPAMRSRRQVRHCLVDVDVDAQWDVARVQQQRRWVQDGSGQVLVEPPLGPHRPLAAAVLWHPEPAVAVIPDGAGPDPAVVTRRALHDVCEEPLSGGRWLRP
ncbi:hypothetical protein [Curtobacterium flaccumfaciens]|uniref:hypothetical protein n=1 Tax=Curtobacterium flaccumfaciens TaxID=2035 RepID=UPI001E3D95B5|nr:hypothetical protein [Curtobacterium allii]MCE0459415.1 hypothetical protein [Curtobacterium allii]